MLKRISIFLIGLLLLTNPVYAAFDPTKPDTTDTVADCLSDTKTNFEAINGTLGTNLNAGTSGVLLPSGAVFFMLTGSCPAGTTDVTATYADKFVKISATQGVTSNPVLTGTTNSHTLTIAEMPAHTHSGILLAGTTSMVWQKDVAYNYAKTASTSSTGGGGGHTHTLSSATTLEPSSITMKCCQVD